jgi:hypothetical protein
MTYTQKVSNFQQNQLEKSFWKGSSLTRYLTMVCFVVHQILLFTRCGKGWIPITYWNCLHDFSAFLESGNSQGASLLLVSSSRSREAIYNLFNSLTQSMMDGWQYDGCCNWLVWGWGGGRKEGRKEKEARKSPIQSNCIRFHQTGFLYWTTGWNQKSRPVHVTERLDNWMKINTAHSSTRDKAFSEDQHLFFNSEHAERLKNTRLP